MKNLTMIVALLTSLSLGLTGIGARAEESSEANIRTAAINSLQTWNEAFNNGNLDEVNDLYTSDAVLLMPNGESATTAEGIREFWNTLYGIGFNAHGIEVVSVEGNGDTVIIAGDWSALRAPENDMLFEGKLVSVLERQANGVWKTTFQRWN